MQYYRPGRRDIQKKEKSGFSGVYIAFRSTQPILFIPFFLIPLLGCLDLP